MCREKVELADDIKVKQELIQHKRGELEGFQEDIQQVAKRRESLEKEREEARAKLDHLNSEVCGGGARASWDGVELVYAYIHVCVCVGVLESKV